MTKTVKEFDVQLEIERLKARTNKLNGQIHSQWKYIKDLYAKYDTLKKNGNHEPTC